MRCGCIAGNATTDTLLPNNCAPRAFSTTIPVLERVVLCDMPELVKDVRRVQGMQNKQHHAQLYLLDSRRITFPEQVKRHAMI
jgi:hypothetical protein